MALMPQKPWSSLPSERVQFSGMYELVGAPAWKTSEARDTSFHVASPVACQ